MEIFGILLSLALLMWGAYRGISVILIAPILALAAAAFQGGVPLFPTYTETFMKGLGGFVISYYPIFLLGSLFGAIMTDSGAAASVARGLLRAMGKKHAMWAVVLTCSLLTFGGVSAWVVVFTMYPLGRALFREAGIPKRLLAGAIATGAIGAPMVAFPGSMQVHNAMPMPYFGTTLYAAPILGTVTGTLMIVLSWIWLNARARKAQLAGEGYGIHPSEIAPDPAQIRALPPFWLASLPIALVLALVYGFSEHWMPSWDLSYMNQAIYGNKTPTQVIGMWSLILALLLTTALSVALLFRYFENLSKTFSEGTLGSLLPSLNTAAEVGYGATIASLAGFTYIKDWLLSFSAGNPLVSASLSTNLLAGITGSAAGGLSITLGSLGETYKNMALAAGVSLETLHRIVVIGCSGLDSLPHNGAVITLLTVCGLTHRQSYKDIFVTTVVIPLAVLVGALLVL
ncbi:MAG TPA: GntP family permease [Bdellovibrionota bacterium]|jgi:H+/gluconate symporter-like permease|nr:GntP family permease [Bdellovibrionota bacterium]